MGRSSSIPSHLHRDIVDRWTLGQSPAQIAAWLNERSERRGEETSTSRSSVNRLLLTLVSSQGEQRRMAALNRARMRAPLVQARLERVERQLLQCIDDADDLDGTPETRARFSGKMMALTRVSAHLQRQFRAAGAMGGTADKAVRQWGDVLTEMRARVREADEAVEAPVRNIAAIAGEISAIKADTPATESPAVDPNYAAGLARAPHPVSTTRRAALTESAEQPLTEADRTYAAGFAAAWMERLTSAGQTPQAPELLEETLSELQFQKRLVAITAFRADLETDGSNHKAVVEDRRPVEAEVTLAPETPVPEPFAGQRPLAQMWRLGRADGPMLLTIASLDQDNPGIPEEVPLEPQELAWCAGQALFQEARGGGGTAEEVLKRVQSMVRQSKWKRSLTALWADTDDPDQPLAGDAPELWRDPPAPHLAPAGQESPGTPAT